jgi:GNAT superfamily N-acetyltransferase
VNIAYSQEPNLDADAFIGVLEQSGLAERRPVADRERIGAMLRNAGVIVTARTPDNRLIGVSRAITDFSYCTYLSDLAVDKAYQRQGVGRQLIDFTHDVAGRHTTLILLAAPRAQGYYPHIGMQSHNSCWVTPGT